VSLAACKTVSPISLEQEVFDAINQASSQSTEATAPVEPPWHEVYPFTFTLTWDANTEADLAGYRLYLSSTPGQYVKKSVDPLSPNFVKEIAVSGTNHPNATSAQIQATDGARVYFVLTAFDAAGNESGFSNEVTYTMSDSTPPTPPKGFWARLARITQAILDLFRGGLRAG